MKIGVRLKEITDSKSITPYKLSKLTNISQATIGRILKDETIPNRSTIYIIANALQVDGEWLMTGKGEKEIKDIAISTLEEKHIRDIENLKLELQTANENIDYLKKQIEFLNQVVLEKLNNLPIKEIKETHDLMIRGLVLEKVKERKKMLKEDNALEKVKVNKK